MLMPGARRKFYNRISGKNLQEKDELKMDATSDLRAERSIEVKAKKEEGAFWKLAGVFAAAILAAFLMGLVPMWLSKGEAARQRDAAQANLRLSQLQNRLAAAAINARRGEYEPARIAASDFYTDLRNETDRAESALSSEQIKAVKPILEQRDEVITLLARYDQAASERLTDLYLSYTQTLNPPAR